MIHLRGADESPGISPAVAEGPTKRSARFREDGMAGELVIFWADFTTEGIVKVIANPDEGASQVGAGFHGIHDPIFLLESEKALRYEGVAGKGFQHGISGEGDLHAWFRRRLGVGRVHQVILESGSIEQEVEKDRAHFLSFWFMAKTISIFPGDWKLYLAPCLPEAKVAVLFQIL